MMSKDSIDMGEQIESLRKNLLDMSLRNNLLNFRELKRSIPIVNENILDIFQILVLDEKGMEFLPKPDECDSEDDDTLDYLIDSSDNDGEEYSDWEERENIWHIPHNNEKVPEEYIDTFLQTNLTEKDLQKKLFDLFQNYKTAINEKGFNNVFIALGFLEWKEIDHQDTIHKAPLVLVPVEISRKSVGSPFKIKWNQADIRSNLSLKNKLVEQNVDFPIFEYLESKEELVDYFKAVENVISSKNGWNLSSEVYVSTFSFKKFVMYKDINLDNWSKNTINNSILQLFEPDEASYDYLYDFDVDEDLNSEEIFQVLDADSSQIEVIEQVKKGNNLVVEGPPGTGKSQTIVNLIAELLANNKTVLFVSEKMAALEVVKDRLDSIGLGDSCLELHSNKSNKKEVLQNLNDTLNKELPLWNYDADFKELDDLKETLNEYMDSISKPYEDTELTPYLLFGIKESEQQFLEKKGQELINLDIKNLSSFNTNLQKQSLTNLNEIKSAYELVKPIKENPWRDFPYIDLAPNKFEIVKLDMSNLVLDLNSLNNNLEDFVVLTDCSKLEDLNNFDEFISNLNVLRPNLRVLSNKQELFNLIEDIKKYNDILNNIDLNPKISDELFSNFNELYINLDNLLKCSKDISNSIGCSNLTNLNEFDIFVDNIKFIDSNLKIVENRNILSKLVHNLEEYQNGINSLNLITQPIENFNLIKDILRDLDTNLKLFKELSNEISNNLNCKYLDDFNNYDSYLSNLKVLNPNVQIIDDKSKINDIINDIQEYNNQLSSINILNFSEKIKLYKSATESLLLNLKSILEYSNKFYDLTGVDKIDSLKSIDQIIDKSKILTYKNIYKIEDDLVNLIYKINQYQSYSKNINDNVFRLNLLQIQSKISNLNKKLDELNVNYTLIFTDDIQTTFYLFSQYKQNIDNLPIKDTLKDSNLKYKLDLFKSKKDSMSRHINKEFKDIYQEFTGCYSTSVSDDQLISDFDKLLDNNQKIEDLKRKILKYSHEDVDNDVIYNELKILTDAKKEIDLINKEISRYIKLDFNSLDDLEFELINLIEIKELFDFIELNDNIGTKYFGVLWNKQRSNVDDLKNHYTLLMKFNDLLSSGFFTNQTLIKMDSIDEIDFSILEDELRNLKKEIINNFDILNELIYLKNELNPINKYSINLNEFYQHINKINEYLSIFESWESFKLNNNGNIAKLLDYDFDKLKYSIKNIKNYSDNSKFDEIFNEIDSLIPIIKSKNKINMNNYLGENFFGDLWEGSLSDITSLTNEYDNIIKFNNLVDDEFFTDNTVNSIKYVDFNDLDMKLSKLNDFKTNIVSNCNDLNGLNLFKNIDLFKFNIQDYSQLIKDLLVNLAVIEEWTIFKSENGLVNISELFNYDFNNLLSNLNNISDYSDNVYFSSLLSESKDILKLSKLKRFINIYDELGKLYFGNFWIGSSSNLNQIKKQHDNLIKFNNLVNSEFFNENTVNLINKISIPKLHENISQLQYFKNQLIDKYEILENSNTFKNIDIYSYDLNGFYDILSSLFKNLKLLKEWEDFKHDKLSLNNDSILGLLEYDLINVKNQYKELSYYCNLNNDLFKEVNNILELKELKESFDSKNDYALSYFGDIWYGINSNTDELIGFYNDIVKFNELLSSEFYSNETLKIIDTLDFSKLNNLKQESIRLNSNIYKLFDNLSEILDFTTILDSNNQFSLSLNDLIKKCNYLNDNIESLLNWRLFNSYCNNNNDSFIESIIPLIYEDKIDSDCIISLFNYNIANHILNDIISNNSSLRDFNENIFKQKIDTFRKLDEKVLEVNRYRVKEILYENMPKVKGKAIAPYSELGVLMREIGKKRRIMPIRKLLSTCINIISRTKPCFMMSPISIAQYLSPHYYAQFFDYVIFDEASQVKTEDAIGALLRGKNYVIMGDSKQLPPTSFFMGSVSENDEDEDEFSYTDVESILQLCKTVFPDKMLKWHYRSRHESLISVSNYEFYNNELIVFPSPFSQNNELGLKVEYNPDNVYDKGKSSKNLGEAKDIIDYAINHFKKYGKSKSLGIGTFSIKQKQAVLEELEFRLRNNPELEVFFDETGEDGFFIKNLENIQGDERDVILISVGYGFDKDKKLSMNFGPLNRKGGERRLNVLITRAREKIVVFTNFLSKNLKVGPNSSIGIQAFKNFLYYAEHGSLPYNTSTGGDFDSPFEKSVYNFLVDEGYKVEKQVGCAGYRIDLAIVDEDNADKYILGIECDGATYHSSPSARDRDRLRQQVLERLGWKFYRIWSTDWFNSRKYAQERLIEVVEEAIKTKDAVSLAESIISEDKNPLNSSDIELEARKYEDEYNSYFTDYEYYNQKKYFVNRLSPENFNTVKALIQLESPICTDEIYNRLKEVFDERKSETFKKGIDRILYYLLNNNEIILINDFYLCSDFDNNKFKPRTRNKPKLDVISDMELELFVINTLKLQYFLPKDDLIKSTSKNIGFKSLSQNVKIKLDNIITGLIDKGIIKENDNNNNLELVKQD